MTYCFLATTLEFSHYLSCYFFVCFKLELLLPAEVLIVTLHKL